MRRLNLSTSLTVAGDATSGTISYSGLTSPTVTEIGDNPDVSVATDGVCTFAELVDASETVTVKVQDAAGYFIQGPVTIQGDGTEAGQYMPIGMNLSSPSTYSGAYHFANMCHSMGPWDRFSGSGGFTQTFGELIPDVPTDIFRAYLSDAGVGWPDGVYHVENPDGCEIAFGTFGDPTARHGWTTSTSFDVTLTAGGGNLIGLFCRGGLTKVNGPLKIMQPGHSLTAKWSNDFLAYQHALASSPIRFMDFVSASNNVETEWSQRVPADAISFVSGCAYSGKIVPWEFIFDLCNELNADAWINIPIRASTDYKTQLAALAASLLEPGLRVYPEPGNETWNYDDAWIECAQWQAYWGGTKLTATANYGANTFTLVNHGLNTGDDVRCWNTPENLLNSLNQAYPYPSSAGGLTRASVAYVERIDADTFKLYSNSSRTTLLTVSSKQINQIVQQNIYGSAATVYGDMLIGIWDIFDAALGVDRVVHVVPSQAGNVGITTSRFSNATAAARADCVAVAPYFNGNYWGARIVTSSGAFSPEVWAATTCAPFTVAVYAEGAAPTTVDEVLLGTGAIFSRTGNTPYTSVDYWRRESAGLAMITGLTNGVAYDVVFVFNNSTMSKATITASASTTTTYLFDTVENQANRLISNAYFTPSNAGSYDHVTASGGKALICYEAGADFNGNWPILPGPVTDYNIDNWCISIRQTETYAEAISKAVHIRATQGISTLTYFADTGTGSFSLAESYTDTSDPRYLAIEALNGRARVYTPPVVADATATRISSDPGSFPHTAYTFPEASLSYTIIGGNAAGNFDISGNAIRMIADTGIDWASSVTYGLSVMADNGYTVDFATIYITAGATVFEAETDALIARLLPTLDSTHKTDINTLIAALKSASVWSKLDGFHINCMASPIQLSENWVSANYDQTNYGGTFTADSGVAGNGSTAYMASTFNPATASSPNFQRNSAHLWAYSLSTAASASSIDVGSTGTAGWGMSVGRSDQANASRGFINSSTVTNYPAQANCKGMYVLTRTTSTLTTMYKDGSSIGTDTAASTVDPGNFTMAALRYNTLYSDKALAGWGFGGGLTGADVSAMSSAIATYLTARGAI